jgi:tight adherence protein C
MVLLLIIGSLLAGLSVALMVRAITAGRLRNREMLAQIAAYGHGSTTETDSARRRSPNDLLSDLATWVGQRMEARVGRARHHELRVLLNSAGFYSTSVTKYLGYRALATVGIPLVFLLLFALAGSITVLAIFTLFLIAGAGWVGVPFYVRRRATERTYLLDREVPELVDLLVTTVEAGVAFAGALQLSARRVREPLGQELRLTLREQSMGLTLDEALTHLEERTSQSVSVQTFVQAIVQGETLGVSIGKILRDLAVDMRKRRRQIAEERAQKAPIKLLFPLVFLILPAMLIVILGPAVYSLVHGLGG